MPLVVAPTSCESAKNAQEKVASRGTHEYKDQSPESPASRLQTENVPEGHRSCEYTASRTARRLLFPGGGRDLGAVSPGM